MTKVEDGGEQDERLTVAPEERYSPYDRKRDYPYGIAPVHRSQSAYRYMRDGDGDGVVCE